MQCTDQMNQTGNTKNSTKQSEKGIYMSPSFFRSLINLSPRKKKKKTGVRFVAFLRQAGVCVSCFRHTAHATLSILLLLTLLLMSSPAEANAVSGIASFYGNGERLNKHTANGDLFNPKHLTAASYHFPMGSYVQCKSVKTGKSVTVYVNDLGPNKRFGRLIDLSKSAFGLIDNHKNGLTKVECHEI